MARFAPLYLLSDLFRRIFSKGFTGLYPQAENDFFLSNLLRGMVLRLPDMR